MIERVEGDVDGAEAQTAHLIDWYLDWAGGEQVARGRFTAEQLTEAHTTVRAHVRADLPGMLGPRGRLLIDRQNGKVSGMVGLKPVDVATGEVKRMIVDPAYRGLGIARALIERLIADARADGYNLLRLETADFMTSAQALYRSVGFRDVAMFDDGEAAKIGLVESMRFLELTL
ncbi:GNAT family N-acetyltransferase [Sporichthya sp.]|uniref:GNAT family N-acetyltransferase n=1 Tax=Sporichthya sp. TaxID=65475 RepID=UPI0017A79838|nr:GNAT family N-acetyltransferase [Sporichthya sp.]MBA3743091.1 GNAT family N-acetyltransferase [Sporichthya sp.]